MGKITILCVGKVKEKYLTEAMKEYEKRLSRYDKLTILEVPDEKTPESGEEAEEKAVREKEGKRLLEKIPKDAKVITLEIQGEMISSEELAAKLSRWAVNGESHLCFIIGGSLGLSPEVMDRSDYALSFSRMTFPHQLMRVILLEQLYRAERINHHEPYHK